MSVLLGYGLKVSRGKAQWGRSVIIRGRLLQMGVDLCRHPEVLGTESTVSEREPHIFQLLEVFGSRVLYQFSKGRNFHQANQLKLS